MNRLKAYFLYARIDIKSQLKYPLDFFIEQAIWLIYTIIPFVTINILFNKVHTLGIWSVYHVGILYSLIGMSYDLSRLFGRSYDDFHKLTMQGGLDVLLIRPISLNIQLLGSKIFLRRIAGLMQYILVLTVSVHHLEAVRSSLSFFVVYFIALAGTCFVFFGLLLLNSALCIFTIRKNLFSELFIDTTASIGYYPLGFINKYVKYFFMSFIPIGFTAYYPMQSFFSYESNIAIFNASIASLLIGAVFLVGAKKIFAYSLRFYKSYT